MWYSSSIGAVQLFLHTGWACVGVSKSMIHFDRGGVWQWQGGGIWKTWILWCSLSKKHIKGKDFILHLDKWTVPYICCELFTILNGICFGVCSKSYKYATGPPPAQDWHERSAFQSVNNSEPLFSSFHSIFLFPFYSFHFFLHQTFSPRIKKNHNTVVVGWHQYPTNCPGVQVSQCPGVPEMHELGVWTNETHKQGEMNKADEQKVRRISCT